MSKNNKPYNGPLLYPIPLELPKFQARLGALVRTLGYGGQNDIMRKTGIHTNSIRNYVRGISSPTLNMCVALCNYFGVSLDWLAGLSDEGGKRK